MIPPRTAVIGMLGSVLQYPRDSYYDDFDPENFRISVSVYPETIIKKQMQSINYLHDSYYTFLKNIFFKEKSKTQEKDKSKKLNMHSQCKLELLIPRSGFIAYTIYLGCTDKKSLEKVSLIESKIKERDFGFGVYLGQRQFRADIDDLHVFGNVSFLESSEYTDTLCLQEHTELDTSQNIDNHIVIDQMPIHMQKEKQGRSPHTVKRVLHEKFGKRIFGKFKNCYQADQHIISFYEG